jgi:hypothetical protein
VGLNGTVVSAPHSAHVTCVSGRGLRREPSLPLHLLQRFGSFVNCFSLKKACSPELNTNSAPHSRHFRKRSANSMAGSLFLGASRLRVHITSRVSSLTIILGRNSLKPRTGVRQFTTAAASIRVLNIFHEKDRCTSVEPYNLTVSGVGGETHSKARHPWPSFRCPGFFVPGIKAPFEHSGKQLTIGNADSSGVLLAGLRLRRRSKLPCWNFIGHALFLQRRFKVIPATSDRPQRSLEQ